MLGLFGTLNLGTRSLQTQRTGVEVAGQNLANVNNPEYARQRLSIQTAPSLATAIGSQGTGVDAVAIRQIRSALVDGQVQSELSVGGYWQARQDALGYAQSGLGEFLDRSSDSANSTSSTTNSGSVRGLASELSGLFNAFQSVSTSPASLSERQALARQAQSLTDRFNQTASRIDDLGASLDRELEGNVTAANRLLGDIARINEQIATVEFSSSGAANDLRDLRQGRLEELAKLVNIETGATADGSLEISVNGNPLVSGRQVLDTLETYDAGGGQLLVRTAVAGTPLNLTGGALQGIISTRDGALASLRNDLDGLAAALINEVNAAHVAGFSLTGSTGAAFFTGTDAATISFNQSLKADPSLIQLSGTAGAAGDNAVALTLAQLAGQPVSQLGGKTFSGAYNSIVSGLGTALSDANSQMADHGRVKSMLLARRDSISGVSIDEEMADLMKYQKAYEASARIVTTVDEMLNTILNLKR